MRESERERLHRVYGSYTLDGGGKWDLRNPGNRKLQEEQLQQIAGCLARLGVLDQLRILEVGCGNGNVLRSLVELGASPEKLQGVDVLEDRIEEARSRNPDIKFSVSTEPGRLPAEDASFDAVLAITLFGSILDHDTARRLAVEMGRVVRPGGGVVWLESRWANPSNPNVRGYRKEDIADLFPGWRLDVVSSGVIPQVARRLGPATGVLYPLLRTLPFMRFRYVGIIQKQ